MKSSVGDGAVLELPDAVKSVGVSMGLAGTALSVGTCVLSDELTTVLALPAVDRVKPAPRDGASMDDGEVLPAVVLSTASPFWYEVEVVTFGSPTTAVAAGDLTSGVVV